jgi:hypothetical protein
MKLVARTFLSLSFVGLGACAAHVCPQNPPHTYAQSASGVVRDADGRPVRARVAAVGDSGSYSTGTSDDGAFALDGAHWPVFVLHASTDDDRVAILADVRAGSGGLELVVAPAGAIVVHADAPRDVRCALFRDGVRFEDFTLRSGNPARVVVPVGAVRVELYEPEGALAEREVEVALGEEQDVGLVLRK